MKLVLLFIATVTFADVAHTACDIDADIVSAKYKVTRIATTNTAAKNTAAKNIATEHVVLWRDKNQVVHQYQERGLSELWQSVTGDRLRLVRYFDRHRRGIEYAPDEIKQNSVEKDWSLKYQLISDQLIHKMERVADAGTGCEQVLSYAGDQGHASLQLDWLPAKKLVKRFSEKTARAELLWELEEVVIDPNRIRQRLSEWDGYQTTDYIDIGDNESDPFLMQMINLGFVKHGASGFYDAEGHPLHGQGGHH